MTTYLRARVPEYLSAELVEKLRELGDRHGPLAVAYVAANLTDPNILVGELTGGDAPTVAQTVVEKLRRDGIIADAKWAEVDPGDAALARYRAALASGLSDAEARAEGWPSDPPPGYVETAAPVYTPDTPHNLNTTEGRYAFLSGNVDARDWASAWLRAANGILARNGVDPDLIAMLPAPVAQTFDALLDYGWMIGWFANAIEAGREAGTRAVVTAGEDTVRIRVNARELARAVRDHDKRQARRA